MADTETTFGSISGLVVLSALLGYFVYGQTLTGALGMVLLCIVLEATVLISAVPFAGVFIQVILNLTWTIPTILGFIGLGDSWLVALLFIATTAIGAILTIFTTLLVLGMMD